MGRYIEVLQIARSLLHTGSCSFHGKYYNIDIPLIGPLPVSTIAFPLAAGVYRLPEQAGSLGRVVRPVGTGGATIGVGP